MINSRFDIKSLPEIQDIACNNVNKILDNIKDNYKLLKCDAYNLVIASLITI